VLNKNLKGWITEATPICGKFACALRMHITSLHPATVDVSSDDDAALSSDSNDDFSPILLPPGFQPASVPPPGNPQRTVCGQIVNLIVFYPDDSGSGPHCLSSDNYTADADKDSPNHTWLLIEPSNP